MKVATKQTASERLVAFLKEKRSFFKPGIDVDHYLARIEQSGARIAVSELLQQAEAADLHLPPGYWGYIEGLKQELDEQK